MKVRTNLTEVVLEIKDLSRGGMGVGEKKHSVAEPYPVQGDEKSEKAKRPKIYFVPFTAPGDIVRARIVREEKTYTVTELIEILTPSNIRIEPKCGVFSKCGGCAFQHIPYELQWKTKRSGMLRELKKATQNHLNVDAIELDEFPARSPFSYRNRIQLRGRIVESSLESLSTSLKLNPSSDSRDSKRNANQQRMELGYFAGQSRSFVPINRCEIAKEELNQFISKYDVNAHRKALGASSIDDFKLELEVDSDHRQVKSAYNQGHGAFGFRQVNDDQNKNLQDWIENQWFETKSNSSRILFDLFGGSGNFSKPISKYFDRGVVVDVVIHDDGTMPSHFKAEKMEVHRYFEKLELKGKWPKNADFTDVNENVYAIIDPPRSGLKPHGNTILKGIERIGAGHVILIGCEVDAWVRDVRLFLDHGFRLKKLAIFDFFPQTPHVESVALFEKFST